MNETPLASALRSLAWGAERSDSMSASLTPEECAAVLEYIEARENVADDRWKRILSLESYIGDQLGMSHFAAWQKFHSSLPIEDDPAEPHLCSAATTLRPEAEDREPVSVICELDPGHGYPHRDGPYTWHDDHETNEVTCCGNGEARRETPRESSATGTF